MAQAAVTNPTTPGAFPYGNGNGATEPGIGLNDGLKSIDEKINTEQTGIIKNQTLRQLVNGWTSFFLQYYLVVAVGILIYMGVRLVVSQGKEDERKKLLQALINLVIGTLVIFLAYVIVNQVVALVDPTGIADQTPPANAGTASEILDLGRKTGSTR